LFIGVNRIEGNIVMRELDRHEKSALRKGVTVYIKPSPNYRAPYNEPVEGVIERVRRYGGDSAIAVKVNGHFYDVSNTIYNPYQNPEIFYPPTKEDLKHMAEKFLVNEITRQFAPKTETIWGFVIIYAAGRGVTRFYETVSKEQAELMAVHHNGGVVNKDSAILGCVVVSKQKVTTVQNIEPEVFI
jgi:hypothetical protein